MGIDLPFSKPTPSCQKKPHWFGCLQIFPCAQTSTSTNLKTDSVLSSLPVKSTQPVAAFILRSIWQEWRLIWEWLHWAEEWIQHAYDNQHLFSHLWERELFHSLGMGRAGAKFPDYIPKMFALNAMPIHFLFLPLWYTTLKASIPHLPQSIT